MMKKKQWRKQKEKRLCPVCNHTYSYKNFQLHHIVYVEKIEEETVYMCKWCHSDITLLNTFFASVWNKKLDPSDRREIYKKFINLDRKWSIKINMSN